MDEKPHYFTTNVALEYSKYVHKDTIILIIVQKSSS